MEVPIYAVSGFLGLPSDWSFLTSPQTAAVDWQSFSWKSLSDWGIQFNEWVQRQGKGPSILIGYSLGGRLALHALLNNPSLWRGAVIISAHPGLVDHQQGRAKRLEHDRRWAARFESEAWASLMQSWNAQEVFSRDAFVFERKEKDYQRPQLMQGLLQGSLGCQSDLRQPISELEIPLLWITGSKDHRYCALAQTLCFKHSYPAG